jgi:subtilisin family serine protease
VEKVEDGLQVWEHSGIGGYIDVVAPAKDLYTEVPRYRGLSRLSPVRWGNSLATSFVAGTTALILNSFPEHTLDQLKGEPGRVPETVRRILRETASNEILGQSGPNPYTGYGLIGIKGAVEKARATKIDSE